MAGFKVDVSGVEEVQRTLRELAKTVAPEVIEKDLYVGADIITREVRYRAPMGDTGDLKKSAVTRVLKRRGNLPASVISAIDLKVAPHAHWVEKGTGPRRVKKKRALYSRKLGRFFGREVGSMPKTWFFKRAVEARWDKAIWAITERLKLRIDKAVQ